MVDTTVQNPLSERGWGGADIIGGTIKDRRPELTGRRGRENFWAMRNREPVLVGAMTLLESMVRGVDWSFEAESDTPEAMDAKEFAEGCLFDDMSHTFGDFIADAVSMAVYGWAYFEIIYKLRIGPDQTDPSLTSSFTDGRWGIRKLAFRSQHTLDRWELDDAGGIQGMWQMPPGQRGGAAVLLPIDRCLHLSTTPAGGSPEGQSLLYGCYDTWRDLWDIRRSEKIAIKREMAGIPLAMVPEALMRKRADQAEPEAERARAAAAYSTYQKIVTRMRESDDAGFIIPSDPWVDQDGKATTFRMYELGFVPPAGRRSIDMDPVIKRYEANLAKALLMNFLSLDGGKGSYALADELVDVALGNLNYLLDRFAEVLNRHLITRLWRLNGLPFDLKPELRHGPFRKEDIAQLADYISKTAASGFLTPIDKPLEDHVRNAAGLPETPDSWEPADQTPAVPPGGSQPPGGGQPGGGQPGGGMTPDEAAQVAALKARRDAGA